MRNKNTSPDYGSQPSYGSKGTGYGSKESTRSSDVIDVITSEKVSDKVIKYKNDVATQSQHLNPSTHEHSAPADKNKPRK